MIKIHTLGFPRIGENRELKFALEKFWQQNISAEQLETTGRELRAKHWALQHSYGLDFVTVGDFAFYDQVANHIQLLGCEPTRFHFNADEPELLRYFALARGISQKSSSNKRHSSMALEMTKWFDTNYHYLVPELHIDTQFHLNSERLFNEVKEAKSFGYPIKVTLIGPLSFLWLSKEKGTWFDKLTLLERLLPVYKQILQKLSALEVHWVQCDEPILGIDLNQKWQDAFISSYHSIKTENINILLATYFSPLKDNIKLINKLDVAGWHIDAIRATEDLEKITSTLSIDQILSIGIIDGRNIWRTNLKKALIQLKQALTKRANSIWISTSCSLLHVPFTLATDKAIHYEIRNWLAGATEKLAELRTLKKALIDGEHSVSIELNTNNDAITKRNNSLLVHNSEVAKRIMLLPKNIDKRHSKFSIRQIEQRQCLSLPIFPTTTIGSFPQTLEIRKARAALKHKTLSFTDYQTIMKKEIAYAIQQQEAIDIDVLVHGEAERNDMVEYFGEQLSGFTFTNQGWVQSYGSRCVKPPILFGDVTRPHAMTLSWIKYAQSLTNRPVKGMLTGPITILQWSFVRDDQSREKTALQIALAIRDEVLDLEKAGIRIIQIDEPAIREGLPLHKSQWYEYLKWAAYAFRVSSSGVSNATQIHTHMCYSEFNDILQNIAAMDADVITIETSRSDMELLKGFGEFKYPNEIGPGVYDIHSPRIPEITEIIHLLEKATMVIPPENLWVNPDCGLKTRTWPEVKIALHNMVTAAKQLRLKFKQ